MYQLHAQIKNKKIKLHTWKMFQNVTHTCLQGVNAISW